MMGAYLWYGFGYEDVLLVAQTEATIPVVTPDIDDTGVEVEHLSSEYVRVNIPIGIHGYAMLLPASYMRDFLAVQPPDRD